MFKQITAIEAKTLMKDSKLTIIDVRDPESYQNNHMPGAKHFSIQDFTAFCEDADLDTPILVYCYKGISSQSVAQHLIEAGFKRVYSLTGGFAAWEASQAST